MTIMALDLSIVVTGNDIYYYWYIGLGNFALVLSYHLTLMLLAANLADTKWCKKAEKWLKA